MKATKVERGAVLRVILDEGPLYAGEVAERLGMDPATVGRACARLRNDGKIRSIGKKHTHANLWEGVR